MAADIKLSISVVQCPRCGYILPASELEDSHLQEGTCPDCDLKVEVVFDEYGIIQEVKPKTIN